MKVVDFVSEIKKFELPISQGLDLASYLLNIDYDDVKLNSDLEITSDLVKSKTKYKDIQDILDAIKNGFPISYITYRREFYGREFYVNENTLIPRVCTEFLIDTVMEEIKKVINQDSNNGFLSKCFEKNEQIEKIRILDLCTGTGAIGLTIAKELELLGIEADIYLLDVSEKAIEVAKENCERLNAKNCNFIVEDVLFYNPDESFHIIISNPPYISENEYESLDNSVKYEPVNALVAQDEGLFFYKFILSKFSLLCKYMGMIFFEIGYNQGQDLIEISKRNNLNCEIKKDYSNLDRVSVIN